MMSDSKTNRPISDEERKDLVNALVRERYGEWAISKHIPVEEKSQEE